MVWGKWTSSDNISIILTQLRPWHITVLIMSILNIGIKTGIVYFIYTENQNEHPYNQLK